MEREGGSEEGGREWDTAAVEPYNDFHQHVRTVAVVAALLYLPGEQGFQRQGLIRVCCTELHQQLLPKLN